MWCGGKSFTAESCRAHDKKTIVQIARMLKELSYFDFRGATNQYGQTISYQHLKDGI
jgi:hypothetical protein